MLVEKINIDAIPDYLFEGYYWYSYSPAPEPFEEEKIEKAKFSSLPFVIEGNFYAKAEQVSIQVKHINGEYHITQFNLAELKPEFKHEQIYLGHDLGGRDFKMLEAWEEVADPYLENMKTLQPAWSAFIGFVNYKKQKS
jgi:CRISPR type III-associated protein (TIGR04423 family)